MRYKINGLRTEIRKEGNACVYTSLLEEVGLHNSPLHPSRFAYPLIDTCRPLASQSNNRVVSPIPKENGR